ncbi:GNAT family N-acetyltransferase [Desulfovibrio subterraneus]|uniref:GNAT family N-acetyltransferase n=1 Tax=Desulfovibrio subterraneus TaxID=2718620 RepID=UPI0022B8F405|nr:GNAT family N-acetyltransferase [Desulfovibrio subterraneus]WBF66921.1 GNAT family N-acetyltransferase [Desulfovibrio subterraneus]
MNFRTRMVKGAELLPHLESLADLRLTIFCEFPYLYQGDKSHELDYLKVYAESPDAMAIMGWEGEAVAGAVTGVPLASEAAEFTAGFAGTAYPVEQGYYIGELLFHRQFRGGGRGSVLLEQAEAHVRSLNRFRYLACATVVRPDNHPMRPSDFVPIERFLQRHAYDRMDGVTTMMQWPELGGASLEHVMQFWVKEL